MDVTVPKPLRVAVVAYTRYRTDARVRREAEALAARGDSVVAWCLRSTGPSIETIAGVQVRELRVRRYRGDSSILYLLSYALFMIAAGAALLAGHLRRRYDVVHVHNMPDFMVLAALPARLLGARVILDIHDTTPESYAGKFGLRASHPLIRTLGLGERICAALAHGVIVVHEIQKDLVVSRGTPASRVTVVMNSPDETLFPPVRRDEIQARHVTRENGFNLSYHGLVARRHGLDLLLRSVASLTHAIPGLRLTVCGEGDHLPEVSRLARDLGLERIVTFAGMLPLERMADHLREADLEVLPLRRDAATDLMLPVKAMEAIACGVPILSAECRALRRHFGDDAILFCESGDPEAMARAIHGAWLDGEGRLERARRASLRLAGYAWRHQKERLMDLVDDLTGRHDGDRLGAHRIASECRIHPNVTIGPGAVIEEYAVIGRPPAGAEPGQYPTVVGAGAVIRSHAVIYAGCVIGDRFQAGHHSLVRENTTIGDDASLGSGSILEHHVTVGDRVRIHSQAFVPETTVLEDGCWIGPNVVFTNVPHPLCPKAKQCLKGAVVQRGAKIGANTTLLPDITIGRDALVGAGSLVLGDVPPGVVVAGTPARVIKEIRDLSCPYGLIERPYESAAVQRGAGAAIHARPAR
ncbi:MAG TPA: glycosyltransferase [Candidatus Polarisedimenticolia bacterium]|jgi:acetyltransferase-like isoleucine patch superfamily enzyme